MSIADEIQDLNTNLTAAKAAVTAKGGTVGDTGLAGLADEIAGIPSGGGGSVPVGDYGKIAFYKDVDLKDISINESGCTATIVDSKKAADYYIVCDGDGIALQYNARDNDWAYTNYDGSETHYTADEILSLMGISINRSSLEAYVGIYATRVIDFAGEEKQISLDTADELNLLSLNTADFAELKGSRFTPLQISKIVLGSAVTSVPDNFANGLENLKYFDASLATNFTTVGDNCFTGISTELSIPSLTTVGNFSFFYCSGSIYLRNVTTAGNNFLQGCRISSGSLQYWKLESVGNSFCESAHFDGNGVTLPATLRTIGNKAFYGCSTLTSIVVVSGSRLSSIGTAFCNACVNLTNVYLNNIDISGVFESGASIFMSSTAQAAYLAGIQCTGTYASNLKTAFPNTTSGSLGRKWRT